MSRLKVKRALFESLMELLDDSKFEDISVEMICENSGVSRSTFYRNFPDKQSLMIWKIASYYDSIYEVGASTAYLNLQYIIVFDFMRENQDYFRKLSMIRGQNSFEDYLTQQILYYFNHHMTAKTKSSVLSIRTQYDIETFARCVVYITMKWIQRGFREDSEFMTEILFDHMPEVLKEHFAV